MPDVDSPDIQTIASEDAESFVHAARSEAEELGRALEQETTKAASAAHRATDQAKKAAGRAQATASSQARALGASVKRADQWLAGQVSAFEAEHPRAAQAVVVSNLLAVVGLGAFLGLRAWGLHDQGRLGGKSVAVGLAVLGAVGAVESAFAKCVLSSLVARSLPLSPRALRCAVWMLTAEQLFL